MSKMDQEIERLTALHNACVRAEKMGREFFKANQNHTAAVNEARKLFASVVEQDSFVCGRNLEFWGR